MEPQTPRFGNAETSLASFMASCKTFSVPSSAPVPPQLASRSTRPVVSASEGANLCPSKATRLRTDGSETLVFRTAVNDRGHGAPK